ncbi:MAG: PTS lactose/cellobiose transporter subunit IIA [Cellulosilyticaceae bacterium]
MDDKMIEIVFGIIAHAGDGKGLAMEAIRAAKTGKIDEARDFMEKSKEEMHKAHAFQTELIQQEAGGTKVEVGVLLIHAQDHLMTALNFQLLAEEFIDLYERMENK